MTKPQHCLAESKSLSKGDSIVLTYFYLRLGKSKWISIRGGYTHSEKLTLVDSVTSVVTVTKQVAD